MLDGKLTCRSDAWYKNQLHECVVDMRHIDKLQIIQNALQLSGMCDKQPKHQLGPYLIALISAMASSTIMQLGRKPGS